MLTQAPLESARFGLRVFRAEISSVEADALVKGLVAQSPDLVILRIPTRTSHAIQAIESYGFHPIHADTLAHYESRLQDYQPKPLRNPADLIQRATADDATQITVLINAVFADYPNHYHANPLLDRQAALDGYSEWALSHLSDDRRVTWVIRAEGRVAGIACSSFDEKQKICQGTLHGVHPDFVNRGYYTDLIRHTQHYFRERDYRLLRIATQIGNLQVQRVWVREGFVFTAVFDTFHVNALLDTRCPDLRSSKLRFAADVASDHGAALNQFLASAADVVDDRSSITQCSGTIFERVRPNRTYALHARRYPLAKSARAIWSATLRDPSGSLCAIAQLLEQSQGDGRC